VFIRICTGIRNMCTYQRNYNHTLTRECRSKFQCLN